MTRGRKACTKSTPEKDVTANAMRTFVEHLTDGGTVTKAAAAAGICRQTAYNWRETDKKFAEAWDDAIEAGTQEMEAEAIRRAVKGTQKPVFHQGQVCGHVNEYSDTLLIFMLKARRPKVYRERVSTEVTGLDGQPLTNLVPVINLTVGSERA
ncbi:MAG: terminase [Fluviibacter sp.]